MSIYWSKPKKEKRREGNEKTARNHQLDDCDGSNMVVLFHCLSIAGPADIDLYHFFFINIIERCVLTVKDAWPEWSTNFLLPSSLTTWLLPFLFFLVGQE